MLKIIDNVDLIELEKYGFKKVIRSCITKRNTYIEYFKKVYLNNDNDDRICYYIDKNDRLFRISRLDGEELDNTLYDLIKADLVEKVEE